MYKLKLNSYTMKIFLTLSLILALLTVETVIWLMDSIWALYGAYIQLWLERNCILFLVLLAFCSLVAAVYGKILSHVGRDLQSGQVLDIPDWNDDSS